jgi:hypothetical protein
LPVVNEYDSRTVNEISASQQWLYFS